MTDRAELEVAGERPRDVAEFYNFAGAIIANGDPTSFVYSVPRDGKMIDGPSARFAEVVVYAWGNCRAGARVINETAEFVVVQGIFHDLQRNTQITFDIQRRIVDKKGRRYSPDMIALTANAACSIALRNAVLKGVPKVVWQQLYDVALEACKKGPGSLAEKIEQGLKAFASMGVTREQVAQKLGLENASLFTPEHLVTLRGMWAAVRDGETTLAELFPPQTLTPPTPPEGNQAAALVADDATSGEPDRDEAPPVKHGRQPKARRPGVTREAPTAYLSDDEARDYLSDLEARLLAATAESDVDELAAEHDGAFAMRLTGTAAERASQMLKEAKESWAHANGEAMI